MYFSSPKNFLVFTVLFVVLISASKATVTVTSNFDNYEAIIKKLTSMTDKLTIFRAVWGEICADYSEDVDRMKTFYDNLLKHTQSAMNNEAEEAAELIEVVRDVLVTENGRLLAETLNFKSAQNITQVRDFRANLLLTYGAELLFGIFEQAIDAAYPFRRADQLLAELNAIDAVSTNAKTYSVRVHWNLFLYYKFLSRADINDEYVFAAASAFRDLQTSTYYKTLPRDTKRRMDAVFISLPNSLRVLINATSICLENGYFSNFFLYYPESSSTSAVHVVVRNRFEAAPARMQWLNSYSNTSSALPADLNLKAQSNNWFLYRQQYYSELVVQKDDNKAILRNWVPSLKNGAILFEQSGLYICASSAFDGQLLGYVVKAIGNISMDNNTDCHWKVTDCASI